MEAGEPEMPPGRCSPRDLLSTGPGPDAGGSNQGRAGWLQTPERPGIDPESAALADCAGTRVAAALAKVTNRMRFRRIVMPASHSLRLAYSRPSRCPVPTAPTDLPQKSGSVACGNGRCGMPMNEFGFSAQIASVNGPSSGVASWISELAFLDATASKRR